MKQNRDFFMEQCRNSEIKMQIVLAAFRLWLKDNRQKQSLSYFDLFAGQGVYDDGTFSTPICIMQEICESRALAQKFSIILNDKDSEYVAKLRRAIINVRNAKYVKTLTTSRVVAERHMNELTREHCFIFLDPWGWKGMNHGQIENLLKNPNCEIALLFSFNQFNRFMNFDKIDGLFSDLFDATTLQKIRNFCAAHPKQEKEPFILKSFIAALTKNCAKCYCLPFKFKQERSLKTSHYVIFIIRDKKRFLAAQAALKTFANHPGDTLCYKP